MNRNHLTFCLCFVLVFLLTNCKSKKDDSTGNIDEPVVYPMEVIRDTLTADFAGCVCTHTLSASGHIIYH